MSPDEEYEIIPTSPLRRLEKRLETVEAGSYSSEVRKLIEQIMELIKSNQRIVDDSIKANHDLITEISKLPRHIEGLVSEMKDFMNLLKASAEEETAPQIPKDLMQPLVDKVTELIEQNKKGSETSQAVLATLNVIEKRLKRLYVGGGMPSESMPIPPRMPTPPRRVEGFR